MCRRPCRRRLSAAFAVGATGTILALSAAADDHGDGARTATRVALGGPVAGTLGGGGDVDVFRFDLVGQTSVEVRTTGQTDTTGELRDGTGALLATDRDSGPGDNFSVRSDLGRGVYYVHVTGTGDYAFGLRTVGDFDDLHGDTPESSTPLRLLSDTEVAAVTPSVLLSTAGRIFPTATDLDVFRLDVRDDGTDVVVRAAGNADVDGSLVDSSGAPVAAVAGDGNFALSATLDAGIYYLTVGATRRGAYRVLARYAGGRPAPARVDDHGDGPRTATRVALGAPVAGTLGGNGDVDVFRFDLAGDAALEIRTTGQTDTTGELMDSAGVVLATDRDSGPGDNFSIRHDLGRGVYYVHVAGNGDYALDLRAVGELDDLHGDTLESSTPLRLLSDAEVAAITPSVLLSTAGRIFPTATDVDVFRIDVPDNGTEVTIRAAGNADADGTLVDSADATIAADAGAGNFAISATLDAGIYYLKVGATRRGAYRVLARYSIRDDHGDSPRTAADVASLPWSGSGELERPGDRDVFRVAVARPGTLTVYTTGATDTYGTLTQDDGRVLREDDDSRDGANFQIRAHVVGGAYFVEVRAADDRQTGRYRIVVEFTAATGPAAPTALAADAGDGEVRLSWTSADDGGSPVLRHEYRMRRHLQSYDLHPPHGWRRIADSAPAGRNATAFTVAGLANGQRAFFQVRAVNAVGEGPPSGEADATPQAPGSFAFPQVISAAYEDGRPDSVHAADLDGDGDADVLSAGFRRVWWHQNLGGGAFSGPRIIAAARDEAYALGVADLDGDGDADVLVDRGREIAWHENWGLGTFATQGVVVTTDYRASLVRAVDMDGDGDADVLAHLPGDRRIAWYENQGLGRAFSTRRLIVGPWRLARSVDAADLDGDGDADVLATSSHDHRIVWHENLGAGVFSAERMIADDAMSTVRSADVDGDGDADVLAARVHMDESGRRYDHGIMWYENLGAGAFRALRVVATDSSGYALAADVDGDRDADVLAASPSNSADIAWHENLGGTFSAHPIAGHGQGLSAVSVADLDNDGDTDVLTGSWELLVSGSDAIKWYENLSDHGDDHANGRAGATLATVLPAYLHGTLEHPGDRDVFRFATGNGTVTVRSGGHLDTVGRLLDAGGATLATGDDSNVGLNFEIESRVAAGTHYVEVTGFASATVGPYTVAIRFRESR